MTTWHVSGDLLVAYREGRLDPARVMSVEAHVGACADCRATVPADPEWLASSWDAVLDSVERPPPAWVRLVAATPGLRWSWLLANAAVLALAVVAALLADPDSTARLAVFLAVAPVLPVLAVATAYTPGLDPLHEVASATAVSGVRLLLWRSTAVVTASVGAAGLAAAFLPVAGAAAGAWLLPALALSVGTLALATVVPVWSAASLLGGCWLTAVGVTASSDLASVVGPVAQLSYAGVALVAATVLVVRRRRLDPGEYR